jgi:hypothetical protein
VENQNRPRGIVGSADEVKEELVKIMVGEIERTKAKGWRSTSEGQSAVARLYGMFVDTRDNADYTIRFSPGYADGIRWALSFKGTMVATAEEYSGWGLQRVCNAALTAWANHVRSQPGLESPPSIPPTWRGIPFPAEYNETKSSIYFYRPFGTGSNLMTFGIMPSTTISCDGLEAVKLSKNRFVGLRLAPGRHSFEAHMRGQKLPPLAFDALPGYQYFFEISLLRGLSIGYPERALPEIRKLEPEDKRNIRASESVVLNQPIANQANQ